MTQSGSIVGNCVRCMLAPAGQACSRAHAELVQAALSPFAGERDKMRESLSGLVEDFPIRSNTTYPGQIEHAYQDAIFHHEADLRMNPETGWWRVVLVHPYLCGCDALTDELVLHG